MTTKPRASSAKPSPEVIARRRKVVLGIVGGIILAIAAFTAFVTPGFAFRAVDDDVDQVAFFTAQPRIGERTALVEAIPDEAGPLKQQRIVPVGSWVNEHAANEAWLFTFADGLLEGVNPADSAPTDSDSADSADPANDGTSHQAEPPRATTVVEATIGQWPTAAEAQEFWEAQTAELNSVREGEVTVNERTVGAYMLAGSGSEGVMIWRNNTVVVYATGSRAALEAFFLQFAL
jgi:hypothetical protein